MYLFDRGTEEELMSKLRTLGSLYVDALDVTLVASNWYGDEFQIAYKPLKTENVLLSDSNGDNYHRPFFNSGTVGEGSYKEVIDTYLSTLSFTHMKGMTAQPRYVQVSFENHLDRIITVKKILKETKLVHLEEKFLNELDYLNNNV